jgi:hypothetical protein
MGLFLIGFLVGVFVSFLIDFVLVLLSGGMNDE